MTSIANQVARLSLKQVRLSSIAIAALLAGTLALISLVTLARTRDDSPTARTIVRDIPLTDLVAATSASTREHAAVGERAKSINAARPFDSERVQVARPFVIDPNEASYPRALLCLRAAVYHEAGFEPLPGRRAVAQVILNRVRHSAFPRSICDVVFQGAGSPVCQFSFACDEARHRAVATRAWQEAKDIAAEALAGYVEPSVGTSTHYHADYVAPRWAPLLTKVSQIGIHIFYRWTGGWGERPAFSRRYAGEQASAVGRTMELEAATEHVVEVDGGLGVALMEVSGGEIAPEVVRGVNKRGEVVRPGDVWELGANERLVTATLIARLVERRLLSWNAPLRELLPDLAPYMRPELQSVTLVQMLSDSSILAQQNNPKFAASLTKGAKPLTAERAIFFEKALSPSAKSGEGHSTTRDPA